MTQEEKKKIVNVLEPLVMKMMTKETESTRRLGMYSTVEEGWHAR